jgi:hypothetical protein
METNLLHTKVNQIISLCNEILGGTEPDPGTIAPIPVTPPPVSDGNPYADTPDLVPIVTDDNLYALFTMTAPYLQSRFWRVLWDIADKMDMPLLVVNACLLEGEPVENPAHRSDGRMVDLRYPAGNAVILDLIRRLIEEEIPIYDPVKDWRPILLNDFEVRVDPSIKETIRPFTTGWDARMQKNFLDKVQGDPTRNHDNHMHVRFWRG